MCGNGTANAKPHPAFRPRRPHPLDFRGRACDSAYIHVGLTEQKFIQIRALKTCRPEEEKIFEFQGTFKASTD